MKIIRPVGAIALLVSLLASASLAKAEDIEGLKASAEKGDRDALVRVVRHYLEKVPSASDVDLREGLKWALLAYDEGKGPVRGGPAIIGTFYEELGDDANALPYYAIASHGEEDHGSINWLDRSFVVSEFPTSSYKDANMSFYPIKSEGRQSMGANTALFVISQDPENQANIFDQTKELPFGKGNVYEATRVSCLASGYLVNLSDNDLAIELPYTTVAQFRVRGSQGVTHVLQANLGMSGGIPFMEADSIIPSRELLPLEFQEIDAKSFPSQEEANAFVEKGGCSLDNAQGVELGGMLGTAMWSDMNDFVQLSDYYRVVVAKKPLD